MKNKLRAERAKPEHLNNFKLRRQDAVEVFRQTLSDPELAVRNLLESKSAETWTVLDDQENVLCFFGACPVSQLSESATVFALTSSHADRYPREFALRSRKIARGMIRKYGYLFNNVDAEFEQCHRWLEFCGFTIEYANPVKINGYKFYPFHGE